jgi:heme A synthase
MKRTLREMRGVGVHVTTNDSPAPRHDAPWWWIRALALATLVTTFGLIVLGSAVRVTNSGMGCKGWPLCSGDVGPISKFHPLMEQSHRYLASIVTVLIIVLALSVLRAGAEARHVRGPALAALGVIVVQVVLGAVTVLTNNAPVTVALHLLVGALFLGVVTVVAVASFIAPDRSWSLLRQSTPLAWVGVGALFLVFVSGSIVVNAGAQAACTSWPTCFTSPAAAGLVVVQLAHRSMVLVGSVLVVAFLVSLLRSKDADQVERNLAIAGLGLLAAQVVVGAASALDSSHTELADLHLALGAALWGVVVAVFALRARGRQVSAENSASDWLPYGSEASHLSV